MKKAVGVARIVVCHGLLEQSFFITKLSGYST